MIILLSSPCSTYVAQLYAYKYDVRYMAAQQKWRYVLKECLSVISYSKLRRMIIEFNISFIRLLKTLIDGAKKKKGKHILKSSTWKLIIRFM